MDKSAKQITKKAYKNYKKTHISKDGKFDVFTMNGNPVEWLQHLKSMIKPIYGNLYKEMVNKD
jgi:hypothetical protein